MINVAEEKLLKLLAEFLLRLCWTWELVPRMNSIVGLLHRNGKWNQQNAKSFSSVINYGRLIVEWVYLKLTLQTSRKRGPTPQLAVNQ